MAENSHYETQFNATSQSIRSIHYESTKSLNQNLTFNYTKNYFIRSGLAFDEVHMNIMRLKNGNEYTNLAYLLSDQCDFQIKAAVFTDKGRSGFVDRLEISGSLLKQFDDAMDFIRRHDVTSSEIIGTKRTDRTGYPPEAAREIVLNALIHRDYNSVGNTLISIYDDSMEIVSPGKPVEYVTQQDLIKGVSFPRNKRLSEVFYRLGLVEAYGTGIPRVFEIYRESPKMPSIEISESVFRVTLFRNISENKSAEKDSFTRAEFEDIKCISKSKATMELNRLISEGKIVREGIGKSTVYHWV